MSEAPDATRPTHVGTRTADPTGYEAYLFHFPALAIALWNCGHNHEQRDAAADCGQQELAARNAAHNDQNSE